MQQMVIARYRLSAKPGGIRPCNEGIDFLHGFQATALVYRMCQRQSNEGWLEVLTGILKFAYGEICSQVTDAPPRLLHSIGKGQKPQLMAFTRGAGTQQQGCRWHRSCGLEHRQ